MIRVLTCVSIFVAPVFAQTVPANDKLPPIVAVYDLKGPISESGQKERGFSNFSIAAARPLTMLDLSASLGKATTDKAVKAVVLNVDEVKADFSQATHRCARCRQGRLALQ
jgi:hypothetical protein